MVVGVDAGGTKTDVLVVAPDGAVLGWVRGAGANHETIGWEGAAERLQDTFAEALRRSGTAPAQVAASAWGIAGLDWPADGARHRGIVAAIGLPGPAVVVNDAFLVLETGERAGEGVAVVSGTGAVAVGRGRDGRTARTLGVGAGFGDWGSGGDVVRAAAQAVAQQHMGLGERTALTERALLRSGAPTVDAYCEQVWRRGRTHLLPPDVWEVAASGDAVANAIAERVAGSLAAAAGVVARRLGLEACEVLLAGRVLDPGDPVLHSRLVAALATELPGSRARRLGVPPVVGAARAAARAAGWASPAVHGAEAIADQRPFDAAIAD